MKRYFVETDRDILRCLPVMKELRPQLPEALFVDRVRQQEREGFRLAALEDDGEVRAVAGIRTLHNLAWGYALYIDDLVTAEKHRSCGYGKNLFTWLFEYARELGCDQLHLDSGVQRFGAHRFYLDNRMDISSHHFRLILK